MKQPSPTSLGRKRNTLLRTNTDKLSLRSFLPYRLNVVAQAVSGGLSAAYADTYGISPPEWRVLATLGEYPQMTARDVSGHSGMHKTQVSRAVLSLEKRRLLARFPSTADRREEILSLSAAGRRIYETLAPMALRYERGLLQGLSPRERATLDRLIRHLMTRASTPWLPAADQPSQRASNDRHPLEKTVD